MLYILVMRLTIAVRGVNPDVFRRFKAEAVSRSLSVGAAATEAFRCWLEAKAHRAKKKESFFGLKPWDWGPGTEHASSEIDEVLYGGKP